ncbi:MAG: UDP-2,3-diacylglucosamine diphosphatase LpxI [Candidatus Aminicenantes bacterium]
MKDKLGMIAGSGEIPPFICDRIHSQGKNCVVAAVNGEARDSLRGKADVFQKFDLDDINGITAFLKNHQITKVLLAGKIEHTRIFKKGDSLSPMMDIIKKGKDRKPATLISLAIEFLNSQGFQIIDPLPFLSGVFCREGRLNDVRVNKTAAADIAFGWPLVRTIADLDIGQTLVVKDKAVVAVEGMEGTTRAIKRAGELAGPGSVVVKSGRSSQDARIDLPAVGINTVEACVGAGCAALCIEAGRMPFFQKEEALKLANSHNLAVLAKKQKK